MTARTTRFCFAARYSSVPEYVEAVSAAMPSGLRTDLARAGLAEALGNAVLHGAFGLDPAARDGGDVLAWLDAIEAAERSACAGSSVVRVCVRAPRWASGACVVRVRDPGRGFDWRRAAAREGHGLSVLRAAFDELRWNEAGNAVSLILHGAPPRESRA